MDKSYCILYQGDIVSALRNYNINKYIILNDKLGVLYTDLEFDTNILNEIREIAYFSESLPLSSTIELTNISSNSNTIRDSSEGSLIFKSDLFSLTGKDVLIAVIDSGVNYTHPDLIDNNGKSKILKIWDQEGIINPPPEGFLFGSEFSNEELNTAISMNDTNLTKDDIGTGTYISGLIVGEGKIRPDFKGIATDANLIVVKLRSYPGRYSVQKRNYSESDFLAAVVYSVYVAKKLNKPLIINLTVASRSAFGNLSLLNTVQELNQKNFILVSAAGNQRNTYIHYSGKLKNKSCEENLTIEYGSGENLDIYVSGSSFDKFNINIISPSGEVSQTAKYSPENYNHEGIFNIEKTRYTMTLKYPWLFTRSQLLEINLQNMKPGAWTLKIQPDVYVNGEYNVYLPNKNLLGGDVGLLDSISDSTITFYGLNDNSITVGTYDNRYDSVWIGSSRGPSRNISLKPDIISPGYDIISTYDLNEYRSGIGTGVSSSLICGMLALAIEFINEISDATPELIRTQTLKTYLMLSAVRTVPFVYPNDLQGYGRVELNELIKTIASNV